MVSRGSALTPYWIITVSRTPRFLRSSSSISWKRLAISWSPMAEISFCSLAISRFCTSFMSANSIAIAMRLVSSRVCTISFVPCRFSAFWVDIHTIFQLNTSFSWRKILLMLLTSILNFPVVKRKMRDLARSPNSYTKSAYFSERSLAWNFFKRTAIDAPVRQEEEEEDYRGLQTKAGFGIVADCFSRQVHRKFVKRAPLRVPLHKRSDKAFPHKGCKPL